MDKLGNLLAGVLAKQPNQGRLAEVHVRAAFRAVVGEDLADRCESVQVRGGVVTISTSNPALAHQLRLDAGRLLERLNEAGPGRRLREVRVRTGRSRPAPG